MKKKLKMSKSYQKAYDRLLEILDILENGDVGIDELSKYVEEGSELVKTCREKLKNIETDIEQVIER